MPWMIATLAIAMVLDSVSLTPMLQPYNPPWTLLALIYWCWVLPARVGAFAGFCVGLLVDAQAGGVLGLHALGVAFLGYLAGLARPVFSSASLGQQIIVVCILVLVYRATVGWLQSLFGPVSLGLDYWLSPLTVILAWPLVYALLREVTPVRRRI